MRRRLALYRLPLTGVVFLAVLVGLLVTAVVDYSGGFTSRTVVTLYVADAGAQLSDGAQVKLHGSVVGEVQTIESSSRGAKLTLGLQNDKVALIPRGTVARILPKTLVGQDYVDLVPPEQPTSGHIEAGDEIPRDTSARALTLETALDSLLDVLHDVPPQKLASTLNAVATAMQGRGEQLGQTFVQLHRYLATFNTTLPDLNRDIDALATFSRTYQEAAPELLDAAEDLTTTARTITEQRRQFDALYASVTQASDDTDSFLSANGDNYIAMVHANRTTLQTLADYAPEYPCLLSQLTGLVPRVDQLFGAGTARPALHVTLEVTNSRGSYEPHQDEPVNADTRGPRCYPIVKLAPQYPDGQPIQDGSVPPPAPGNDQEATTAPSLPITAGGPADVDLPGSETESHLISGLLGSLGASAPDFASLLLGPILRGSEVSVR